MPSGFALHEAAHCVALLAGGGRVSRLSVEPGRGGSCVPDPHVRVRPESLAVALLAGPAAARQYGIDGLGVELSSGDLDVLREALGSVARDRGHLTRRDHDRYEHEARAVVYEHRQAIALLAERLDERQHLGTDDLAAMCAAPRSPLAGFRWRYPQIKTEAAGTGARESVGTPPGLPPGSRWSDEHQCYLSPAPRTGSQRMVVAGCGVLG